MEWDLIGVALYYQREGEYLGNLVGIGDVVEGRWGDEVLVAERGAGLGICDSKFPKIIPTWTPSQDRLCP